VRPGGQTSRPRAEERLHFDEQGPTSLHDGHHDAARNAGDAVAQHERARVGDGPQAVVTHLEDPHLTGRAEPVLDRRQHS
jgi:hypothetical protein